MSSNKDEIFDKIMEEADATVSYEEKKKIIERDRLDRQTDEILKRKQQLERFKNAKLFDSSDTYLAKLKSDQDSYMESVKNKIPLITKELSEKIPLTADSFLVVGARTGAGKSTFMSNMVLDMLSGRNADGQPRKVLVLSNEEMAINIANNLICLEKGWNHRDRKNFDAARIEELDTRRNYLISNNQLVIIDIEREGFEGKTTTLEGMNSIFENLLEEKAKGQKFDAIFLDYYQKVSSSIERKSAAAWEVLAALSKSIDNFRKLYRTPIIVMVQLKPNDKDGIEFENRIKEGKSILTSCTDAIEVIPNYRQLKSTIVCHKCRENGENYGMTLELGYDRGRLVDWEPFAPYASQLVQERHMKKVLQDINPGLAQKSSEADKK